MAISIGPDFIKDSWRKRFRTQLATALNKGDLSYSDLQHLAERWNQDRKAVLQSLRVLLSAAISDADSSLNQKSEKLRTLLEVHEATEPFSELPENISLQLRQIGKAFPSSNDFITQLAASLSTLYVTNQRESDKQKKLSFWGFVVGLIGIALSIPGLYITFAK
ncbi:hypothetical protein ACFX58_06795 [Sphingomonas sp. NCPPB 2930]